MNFLHNLRADVGRARGLWRLEQRQEAPRMRPGLWMRGFLSDKGWLYPGIDTQRLTYLSDWQIESRRYRQLNSAPVRQLLQDKLVSDLYFRKKGLARYLPDLIAIRVAGEVVPLVDNNSIPFPIFLKPRHGAGGKGVSVVSSTGDWEALLSRKGETEDVILQTQVQNHPYSCAISPHSLNTIRILTVRKARGAESLVCAATHRFGTARSGPVDNVSQGGFMADVELADGSMSNLVGVTRAGRHDMLRHPETDSLVRGVRVPYWAECLALAKAAMAAVPEARHVGWDVAVTPGGPVLIEGNGNPDVGLHQSGRGLLTGDMADFYRNMGVTKRAQYS